MMHVVIVGITHNMFNCPTNASAFKDGLGFDPIPRFACNNRPRAFKHGTRNGMRQVTLNLNMKIILNKKFKEK